MFTFIRTTAAAACAPAPINNLGVRAGTPQEPNALAHASPPLLGLSYSGRTAVSVERK